MNTFAKLYVLHNLMDGRPGNYGLRRIAEIRGYKYTVRALVAEGLAEEDKHGSLTITDAGVRFATARRRPPTTTPRPERVLTPSQD